MARKKSRKWKRNDPPTFSTVREMEQYTAQKCREANARRVTKAGPKKSEVEKEAEEMIGSLSGRT